MAMVRRSEAGVSVSEPSWSEVGVGVDRDIVRVEGSCPPPTFSPLKIIGSSEICGASLN